jgi:periplasmic protein TonB
VTALALSPVTARLASASERGRLAGCLLIVVSAHVVLLASPARTSALRDSTAGSRSVQVRTLALPAKAAGGAAVSTPLATETTRSDTRQLVHRRAAKPVPRDFEPAQAASPLPAAHDAVAQSEPVFMALGADPDAQYLRRSALTLVPKASAPVVIDFPSFAGEAEHYSGEFDLFIDDEGAVVRVLSASAELPRILANAVRDAFLPVRFSPGEVDGKPVRSRIRIEVSFDRQRTPT